LKVESNFVPEFVAEIVVAVVAVVAVSENFPTDAELSIDSFVIVYYWTFAVFVTGPPIDSAE
jgi:hypothetical protein